LALSQEEYQITNSFAPGSGEFGTRDLTKQEKEFIDSCLSEAALNELVDKFTNFFVPGDKEETGY